MASGEAKARLFAGEMGAGRHVIGGAGGLFQTRFVVLLRTQGGLLSARYKAELFNNLSAVKMSDLVCFGLGFSKTELPRLDEICFLPPPWRHC